MKAPISPDGFVSSTTALNMRADIIKVGALGTNGVLTVGDATLIANTLIALYGGSSGSVDFVADVNLNNAATKIIAANTVTIENGVTVTITGAAADVYTNHAHYAALDASSNPEGGDDTTTGQFAGSGATTHLNQTPPPFGHTNGPQKNSSSHGPGSSHSGSSSLRAPSTNDRTTTAQSTLPAPNSGPRTLH